MTELATVAVTTADVDGPEATTVLGEYFAELVGRYHGRPATPEEVAYEFRMDPSTSLAPPTGGFLLAHSSGGTVAGCVGVRLLDERIAELRRMYVRPTFRRRGVGRALIAAAERHARTLGATEMQLDTRSDLVEARALYASIGYAEIDRYNTDPYVDHWFAKLLR